MKQTVEATAQQNEDTKRAIRETSRSATATEQVARHIETSIQTSLGQSESMQRSVAEAARLASAVEIVAKEIAVSSKAATASVSAINRQMRAYVCVVTGSAVHQDRIKNLKFQAIPSIINARLTPAHKVAFKASAAILPVPLPADFTFPLLDNPSGQSVIGPRQEITISPIVSDFCDDADIEGIKTTAAAMVYMCGASSRTKIFLETPPIQNSVLSILGCKMAKRGVITLTATMKQTIRCTDTASPVTARRDKTYAARSI